MGPDSIANPLASAAERTIYWMRAYKHRYWLRTNQENLDELLPIIEANFQNLEHLMKKWKDANGKFD
jgi:hypothetical protein